MSVGARHALLAAIAAFAGLACAAEPPRPPDIVLVVLDTVRADRLSCYGYERPTTPRIDALCKRGIRFENAFSTSSWTLPAHASLFTGLYPIEHGATQENTRLGTGPSTLADILGARGYATFAASANPLVSANTGLDRGFDVFADTWRGAGRHGHPEPAQHPNVRAVLGFLETLAPSQPFFVFVNYVEAHGPYQPPEPHRSRFLRDDASPEMLRSALQRGTVGYYLDPATIRPEEFEVLSDLYDGEVARVDALLGGLVDALDGAGRLENTLVVVTSDHGENLGEHGHFRHVFSLYATTVRIPLLLVLPDDERAGEVRPEPVGLVDVFATVLARAGVTPPAGAAHGRDLLGALGADEPVFAEYYYPLQALGPFPAGAFESEGAPLAPYLRRLRSVQRGPLRAIGSSSGELELYDLSDDRDESRDLAGSPARATVERELRTLLDAFVSRAGGEPPLPDGAAGAPAAAFGELDEESLQRLRELGYLGDDS
jgi:arylsulfatase A-like enzyme